MNKVILMGRLTKDPDMRGEGTGLVARYTLAVDRRFSRNEENNTDFINIVVFGKGAEFAEKYLKKGIKVVVTGRIQTGSYTNKDGQKVYTTDVIAEDQEFAESKNVSGNNGGQTEANSSSNNTIQDDGDFMNIDAGVKDDMPF
ncbi:MAG: single-stranded DNA-binding protein [Lachnospiraceae bacterium]|nr:single-stranded DNA-binding protein [Lachnospiraceae bacterium]